jgi:nuclear pore complex protein Nup205
MIHHLPLLTERQYVSTIHSRLQDSQPWKLPGLQATVRLAWALALRGISQLPDVTGKEGRLERTGSATVPSDALIFFL